MKSLSAVDMEILRVLDKFGHAKISQICLLVPEESKRSNEVIRLRCRQLVSVYGYIEEIRKKFDKVYRLTVHGKQVFRSASVSTDSSIIRGIESLNADLVRAEWAIEALQEGAVTVTSGFNFTMNEIDFSPVVDAMSQREQHKKFLIIDSDSTSNYIGETYLKLQKLITAVTNCPIDVVVFFKQRHFEIDNFVHENNYTNVKVRQAAEVNLKGKIELDKEKKKRHETYLKKKAEIMKNKKDNFTREGDLK
ncbi:hypothetical protein GE107_21550 [Cohnella sp. CFH 77786]|uniref:hypothetical protein n=1 Tax=Cohnella sp. CFH 77786 TaxID=2662265 RepID=UPI001C60F53B|nr:hypothetical protein [Cohnella sp. CFH 77786]MBW5448636.1 hypothetical protein [Cohnella sp. CFH 77786]